MALLLGNGAPFLIALLACARLGAIAVPLNVREQQEGLAYMLVQSGSKLLIHEAELAARLPDLGALPLLGHRIAIEGCTFDALLAQEPCTGAPPVHRPGRGGRGGDPLHLGHHRPAQGRDADPPQHRPFGDALRALPSASGTKDRALLAVPASHVIGLVAMLLAMVHVGGSTVLMRDLQGAHASSS